MRPATVTLMVRVRQQGVADRLGNTEATRADPLSVDGCLFAPTSAADLDAGRPDGTSADATAYFPRGWASYLKRALVSPDGERWFAVMGAPVDYPAAELPDGWPWSVQVKLKETEG